MTDVLLNYVMPVKKTIPIAPANLQYLQNVLVIVKPLSADTPKTIVRVTANTDLAEVTAATAPLSLLKGGKSYFYALPTSSLVIDLAAVTNWDEYEFFTVLIDPAFTDDEVKTLKLPDNYKGVIGGASTDDNFVKSQNAQDMFSWFVEGEDTSGNNMYKAFGSLLSKPKNRWSNQQYLALDYDDGITQLSTAEALFNMRANFALTGQQYGTRLALFVVGSQSGEARAIVAPYLYEEITVTLQGRALTWINLNEPAYTIENAALLEQYLQKTIDNYIENEDITDGKITVTLSDEQFVMSGNIAIPVPSALWRLRTNMIEGEA